jgi:hypothetical protein
MPGFQGIEDVGKISYYEKGRKPNGNAAFNYFVNTIAHRLALRPPFDLFATGNRNRCQATKA